ncbi:receptor kinase-like protein Xa21 [Durio zibethinus]|uniref:non-specific serine/threonine protein kinase n=1 Tax=Durio zibethinus TaxID=66656 RepID=A0A6P5Y0L1_DURZI|nr:receptor kinase-like protein Xa21 [Durio zibethinus]
MANTRFILLLLMVVMLLPCFVVSFSTKKVTNISTDQLALLELKAHVISDPQNFLATNWSTATSVCNWIGVTCGSRHRRVTALNLFGMNLSGTIPPHLGNLSFLVRLSIGNNGFHGSLPIELANFRRLKSIRLSNNNFNGEIPSWFGSFTELRDLSLNSNNFMGVIPSSLCSLSKLEILSLYQNNLQGQIPVAIGNLSSLRRLFLHYNKLSGSIPSSIFSISSLVQIFLSDNQLIGSIPSIQLNISSLKTIDLTFNNLTGHIPPNMFDYLPKLKGLSLSWNQLSGRIPMSLFKCQELEELSLSINNLEGIIPVEIGNLTMLESLYLGDNNLKGKIPDQFGNLPKLEELYLVSNSITGIIPPRIFNSSTVRFIYLTLNQLSGYLPSTTGLWLPKLEVLELSANELSGSIPVSISNASRLTLLNFGSNSFSGYIPIGLGNLRDLQWFNLEYNNLVSTPSSSELSFLSSLANCKQLRFLAFDTNPLISGKLPVSIGNLSVQEFVADGCNIKGSIPGEIGNVSNLFYLNLDNNELTESIPTTIGRLRNLQRLSLQGNKLEGSFPTELCNLKSLSYLYLTGNKLAGSIPACIGDLVSLRHLFLGSNKFANSIPSTLTRLTDILQLNLSSNYLSGALPVDIEKWKVITSIDFSKNQLSGEISMSIGDLRDLTYLSLSGNRLQGPIPESFGGLTSLQVLDLSRNNFSGFIPKSLEKLLYLEHFNVSFNRLEGEIPNKGFFGNYSIQSFMGNKALCVAPQLRLPLPPCKANSSGRHSRKALHLVKYIVLPIGSTIIVLALILIFSRRRKGNANLPTGQENFPALAEWRRVSYQELQQATYGFSESKLLGVGSFGSVYQGILSDGLSVAVKVFNLELEGAFKSFDVECEVLRNIRHRNLVKIISSCSNIDFKALVLEFMPSGSLEKWLYSHNHFLDILHRLNIMIDVASALEYLHHGYTTPVIHCDLKPNNILLDEDMVAHLGDFGIAKLLGEHDSTIHTVTLATIGYMAPEYGSEGVVSTKGDVYSFGILLMETFTRKKPTDEIFAGEMSIKYWVKKSLPSALIEVVDTNLLNNEARQYYATRDCALSILQLALECTEEVPDERIDMKEVVAKLKKIKIKFLHESNRRA